jgi:hypothetical protein
MSRRSPSHDELSGSFFSSSSSASSPSSTAAAAAAAPPLPNGLPAPMRF